MRPDELIEVAARIGRRIVDRARWDGDACTWEVERFDYTLGSARPQIADGALYQGTAGIALFLGELARVAGDDAAARTAAAAIRHALAAAAELPPAGFGFHNGRVGIAWAAARLAAVLDRPELRAEAAAGLASLAGREREDHVLDVVGGAAGAIPALLALYRDLGRDEPLEVACRLGDRLIETARREPGGWSWGSAGAAIVRNLTGVAHGASGIAVALLELARASGRGRYRFAAEMALLYERRLFDAEHSNWPDLRHKELNDLAHSGDPDAVRRAALAGAVPPYRPVFMTAWCHGAPGIGLARLRALALTGDEVHRREAEAALEATLPGLRPPTAENYSLCHGVGGNCELPLEASAAFGNAALRAVCDDCADYGWETYERAGRPWPCGTENQVSDPSLMLGEAGIGHFYLRLADPATPPVLMPAAPEPAGEVAEDGGYAEVAERWVDEEFGTARRAFAALGVPAGEIAPYAAPAPSALSPVETAYQALRAGVERRRGARRELLADAFAVERARHELSAVPNDLTADQLRRLRRAPADAVDWTAATFALAPDVRLVTTDRDWSGGDGDDGATPEDGGAAWLIARQADRLLTRRTGPLAALVADALETPAPLAEVVERVAVAAGLDGDDRRRLRPAVLEQLRMLYRAELIDATNGSQRAADDRPIGFERGLQPPHHSDDKRRLPTDKEPHP
jgi:hypothetical protein